MTTEQRVQVAAYDKEAAIDAATELVTGDRTWKFRTRVLDIEQIDFDRWSVRLAVTPKKR